jgi:hypothetical protein
VDLSRRATPAEGGFCTFQPVVDGNACPWNLDCHNCDRFVLSGADLLYWRRKREQWRQLAEGAPDDVTAAYLHDYFAPTAAAIDGLEAAWPARPFDDALALTCLGRRTTSTASGPPRSGRRPGRRRPTSPDQTSTTRRRPARRRRV